MAVLDRETYFRALEARLAEDSSDEAIKFLEDMTDTYNDLESKANGNGEDWEKRFKENDEMWRKRYRSRFFNGSERGIPEEIDTEETEVVDPEEIKVDDLFEEKEE